MVGQKMSGHLLAGQKPQNITFFVFTPSYNQHYLLHNKNLISLTLELANDYV